MTQEGVQEALGRARGARPPAPAGIRGHLPAPPSTLTCHHHPGLVPGVRLRGRITSGPHAPLRDYSIHPHFRPWGSAKGQGLRLGADLEILRGAGVLSSESEDQGPASSSILCPCPHFISPALEALLQATQRGLVGSPWAQAPLLLPRTLVLWLDTIPLWIGPFLQGDQSILGLTELTVLAGSPQSDGGGRNQSDGGAKTPMYSRYRHRARQQRAD